MNRQRERTLSIGIISLCVIFALLSLATFAVLSLTSARNSQVQVQKSADATVAYYEADYYCAGVVNELFDLYRRGRSFDDILIRAGNADFIGLESLESGGDLLLFFNYPIDSVRQLDILLQIGKNSKILSWALASRGDWIPDDDMAVWDGFDD